MRARSTVGSVGGGRYTLHQLSRGDLGVQMSIIAVAIVVKWQLNTGVPLTQIMITQYSNQDEESTVLSQ